MQKTALIILHDGVEEMEAVAPIDILRRGGIAVTVAAAGDVATVSGRNGIGLAADTTLEALGSTLYDLIVVPGGPGVAALRKNERVLAAVRAHAVAGAHLSAICAAPLVLLDADILTASGEKIPYTAHPATLAELPAADAASAVVVATSATGTSAHAGQKVITSRGAGTATAFALHLLEHLLGGDTGRQTAREVAESICLDAPQ